MILRILAVMLAILPMTPSIEAGVWENVTSVFKKPAIQQKPSIRVLIGMDQPSFDVVVTGPFKGFDPRTGDNILYSQLGKKATMQVMDGGIKWGEEFPGIHQIMIVPTDPATKIYVNGTEYPGAMYFYDVAGNLSAINKVDMEAYLTSILTPLHEKDEPQELLSAIAITARTNAYYLAENPTNPYWAVNAQQVGYHGVVDITHGAPIIRAINETRYMVLSRTGAYEGIVTPFYSLWSTPTQNSGKKGTVVSFITLEDAEKMAWNGNNAAQILQKAFPDANIQLLHYSPSVKH